MKTAVITSGSKQFVVQENDTIKVELLNTDQPTVEFEALLIIDGDTVKVGDPIVKGSKVKATVVETNFKEDKVVSIRFKAKKRVHKRRGHRQQKTVLHIDSIL